MASVITLTSSPPSASMTAQYSYSENQMVLATSSQIVTFDLSALGPEPEFTNIAFEIDSSHSQQDNFTLKMGNLKMKATPQNPGANLTQVYKSLVITMLKTAVKNGLPLSVTIVYSGHEPNTRRSEKQTSTVAFRIIATIVGGGGTVDERSQGTLSAASIAFGESIDLAITPKNADYSHVVTYKLGSHSENHTVAAGVATDSFTLPMAWLDALPGSVTGVLEVTLGTVNNGASLGTQSYTARVTVPDSVLPVAGTLTAEAVNYGALAGDARFFVGASRTLLTLTGATAGQGSQIASITFSGWGSSVTTDSNQYLVDAMQISGNVTMEAVVTDGRGRTAGTTITIVVYDYEQPYFVDIDATRCDENGVPDDEGQYILINAEFGCSTVAIQDNTCTASVAFLANGSGTWSREFPLTNNEDTLILAYPLSISVSYQMRFTVTDRAMSVELYMSVPSAKYIMHFSNSGDSIGVGQAAESLSAGEMGRFTVNPDWTVQFGTNVKIGQQTLAEYIQSIVSSM